ncbi:MAG: bifunctional phosphopantothenoylcysteine decarboxylase/phosphopantothenate--cysteine ligase CoaBC, partial [Flavobacteriales bacterium]
MGQLKNKRILLGVTGSIAAYKSAALIRFLKQEGAEVQVVMTPSAQEFITPLTLATLSERPVISDFTESKDAGVWTRHVDIALWADLMVVAPLSANTLSAMAQGSCNTFLMAVYLSLRCPCLVAPAMDHDMYLHTTTQSNLAAIRRQGHHVLSPGHGALASGLIGQGRMAEPEEIIQAVIAHFHPQQPLSGKRVLITAGPTYEAIDPVRFIGNHASGKMGFAIAEAMLDAGAEVTLVSGPTHLHLQRPGLTLVRVQSAEEMWQACDAVFSQMDIAVMAAAVADYRPAHVASEKIKKQAERWEL